jgi:hypothetical protein
LAAARAAKNAARRRETIRLSSQAQPSARQERATDRVAVVVWSCAFIAPAPFFVPSGHRRMKGD